MAAITHAQIMLRREILMKTATRVTVIVAKPEAIDDATAGVFLVKDPDPGDAPTTGATQPGNAKNWFKSFSYAALGTAYGL